MGSQRLMQQEQSDQGSASDPLCIRYGCWLGGFWGHLTMGTGVSLTLFLLLGDLYSLDLRAFPLFYCISICPVWLQFLEGLAHS